MLCIIYNYSLLLRSIPILTVHRKLNFGGTIRVFEGKYGYLLRGQITSTDFRLLLDMQKPKYCNKICDKTYYCLLPREQFSYSVVWISIVPSSLARTLYRIRQHIRRTVPSGVEKNRIIVHNI